MKLNKLAAGTVPALMLLLAASAGAQIKTTTVPYTPPKDTTDAAQGKATKKAARGGVTKAAAKSTKTQKTMLATATAPAVPGVPASTKETATAKFGPGRNIGTDGKVRECNAKDPSPAGTVIDGYKKVMVPSPIIPGACQWRAVE